MRQRFRTLLTKDSQKRRKEGSAEPVKRPPVVQDEATPSSSVRSSLIEAIASAIPSVITTSASPPAPGTPSPVQAQPEQHVGQTRDDSKIQEPYAYNSDLWNEALRAFPKPEIRELIEEHIGILDRDAKSLAGDIQSKIEAAFKAQQHDSRSSHIIENTIAVLSKFTSAVDVAVSFDPVHAALPWALVRSVLVLLTSRNELKSQLLAGIATVASLLAQCDTYQLLYMVPEFALRPPEVALGNLKKSIVRAYSKSQSFLGLAIQLAQSKTGFIAAPLRLSSIEDCVKELAKCEKQLVRATDDCERTCNLSARTNIQELLKLQAKFYELIPDQIQLVLERIDYQEQKEILDWISPVLYGSHHDRVKEARTSDTCEWLLAHEKFHKWEDANSSMILWLQGSPGAGKTFLASRVIDHIRARPRSPAYQEGFAFFYCDRNEEQRRKPLSVLQSYVRQLSTTIGNSRRIRGRLRDLCREKKRHASSLSFSDCKEQLLESIKTYDVTTIVLDALDECEPDSRRQIFETIDFLLKSVDSLKVFISSRPDRDIRNRFIHLPNIEIQATHTKRDIQKFVHEEVSKHENWNNMTLDLKNRITTILFTQSHGMFQWVFLQIKQLLVLETEEAILDRLGKLPDDLKTAYDEIYGKIKARHNHDRALADNALKWVAAARKPLRSVELLSAIRLDPQQETFHFAESVSESQLLHLCNNLLVIDSERNVWRFSHLSVTEYFENNHWSLTMAHGHCASVCLQALLNIYPGQLHKGLYQDDISENQEQLLRSDDIPYYENIEKQENNDIRHLGHPFQKYARRYWMVHVEAQKGRETDPTLTHLLKCFLGSPGTSSLQYQEWYWLTDRTSKNGVYSSQTVPILEDLAPATIALFAMCRYDFSNILRDWWRDPDLDLSHRNKHGRNALAIAARHGRKRNCESLIRLGIDVDLKLETKCGSALAEAVAQGRTEIVKYLVVEGKSDVNLPLPGRYGSALALAAKIGQKDILEFLIRDARADINMPLRDGYYDTALEAAVHAATKSMSFERNIETVRFLVKNGADVNLQLQTRGYGSVLALAAHCSYTSLKTVQVLVQAGADINLQLHGGRYGSALASAAERPNNLQIVQFLVQAGADTNLRLNSGDYGSALVAAAARPSDLETVRFLVQAGADVNLQLRAGNYGSSLAAAEAARPAELKTVQFLVQAGADVNAQLQVGDYGNALAAAVARRMTWVVEYLVHHAKADVNQQIRHGKYGGSALAVAAFWGSIECAEILIKAGAEVNLKIENGPFRTSLEASQADIPKKDLMKGRYRTMDDLKENQAKVAELLRRHGALNKLEPGEMSQS
ncbi:hypothetical protein F5Y10DRAFT_47475 [Nemania abortiva]|nr:hypothetical protein F5Y10DRAFT_47475 [Nemania abortiva]